MKKHGFDFNESETVFAGDIVTIEDTRFDYGEARFVTLGLLYGRAVVIIHTEQEDRIRIISMRKATKYEEQNYHRQIGY